MVFAIITVPEDFVTRGLCDKLCPSKVSPKIRAQTLSQPHTLWDTKNQHWLRSGHHTVLDFGGQWRGG